MRYEVKEVRAIKINCKLYWKRSKTMQSTIQPNGQRCFVYLIKVSEHFSFITLGVELMWNNSVNHFFLIITERNNPRLLTSFVVPNSQWRTKRGAGRVATPRFEKFRANSVFRASPSCSKFLKDKKYFNTVKNFRANCFSGHAQVVQNYE